MASIQDAIKNANEAAASMATQQGGGTGTDVIEGHVGAGGQVTTFSKPSMSTIAASTGVIPRNTPYLKVNEDGLKIGKNRQYLEGFKGKILMQEDVGFQVKYTIRFGNPAQYFSSYDGTTCDKGGSWGDALQKAKLADPNAEPYPSVDVVIELLEDVKLKDEVLPAGSKVGFNASKTNFSEWQDFFGEVYKAGLVDQEVEVNIGFRAIEHGGNTWGVVTFALPE